MLTQAQLAALHHSLRDSRVLSVYIDGTATDPAIQAAWRVQLDHSIKDLRAWLSDSPSDEREELEACVRLLDKRLAAFNGGVAAPGWVAFITSSAVRIAHPLPTAMPTLAVWSTGPCLAPYVRALKEGRPVIVVVADARKAELYRYEMGRLQHVEKVRAHHPVEGASHMGTPARQGFHSGTHGVTRRDAAQRALLTGRDRMLADAVDRIEDLAGDEAWILLGGIKRVVSRLAEHLAPLKPDRVLVLDSLDVHASEAEISEAARVGASALRDAYDARRVAAIADEAGAHGRGAVGPTDTQLALDQTTVRELYLTNHYLETHGAEAEEAVRAAFDQDALVEEVSGSAAESLEQLGGIAAGLRFRR